MINDHAKQIEDIKRLGPEIVQTYLETRNRKSLGIPAPVAEYIDLLDRAHSYVKRCASMTAAAMELHKVTGCTYARARQAAADSVKYFNSIVNVSRDTWNLYYADQMEELAAKNEEAGDLKEARICREKARDYRLQAAKDEIESESLKMRTIIVSPDVELERMGIKKKGGKQALQRALEIINKANISETDKNRLTDETRRELGEIDDANVIEEGESDAN